MKQLYQKVLALGFILVLVFNPFAVNLWSDALIIGLRYGSRLLISVSDYTVVIGGTLLLVGVVMYMDVRKKKETNRLKKLKDKKIEKAGGYS
jgi:hypothetical protein